MSRVFSLSDLRALAGLAVEAGAIIRRIAAEHAAQTSSWSMMEKPDGSPVTKADQKAEAHILAGLLKLGLAAPVVAEETAPMTDVSDAAGFYLIDPLDGTSAFIAGREDYSVNIGYVAAGVPVAGVLHMPASGDTYYSDGAAAYFLGAAGAEEKIAARAPNAGGLDVILNRTEDWSGAVRNYLKDKNIRQVERRSSAHKLTLIAHGRFDLYPRFGKTSEWDIAAGDAILRAAGGSVTTLDGAPLKYGKKDFVNPAFIAKGK